MSTSSSPPGSPTRLPGSGDAHLNAWYEVIDMDTESTPITSYVEPASAPAPASTTGSAIQPIAQPTAPLPNHPDPLKRLPGGGFWGRVSGAAAAVGNAAMTGLDKLTQTKLPEVSGIQHASYNGLDDPDYILEEARSLSHEEILWATTRKPAPSLELSEDEQLTDDELIATLSEKEALEILGVRSVEDLTSNPKSSAPTNQSATLSAAAEVVLQAAVAAGSNAATAATHLASRISALGADEVNQALRTGLQAVEKQADSLFPPIDDVLSLSDGSSSDEPVEQTVGISESSPQGKAPANDLAAAPQMAGKAPAAASETGFDPTNTESQHPIHLWIQQVVQKDIEGIPPQTPIEEIVPTYQGTIDTWAQKLTQSLVQKNPRLAITNLIEQITIALRAHLAAGLIDRQTWVFLGQRAGGNPLSNEEVTEAANLIQQINPEIDPSTIFSDLPTDPVGSIKPPPKGKAPAAAPAMNFDSTNTGSNHLIHPGIQTTVQTYISLIDPAIPIENIISTHQKIIDDWALEIAQNNPHLAIEQIKIALRAHMATGLIERQKRLFQKQREAGNPPSAETIAETASLIQRINPEIDPSTIFCEPAAAPPTGFDPLDTGSQHRTHILIRRQVGILISKLDPKKTLKEVIEYYNSASEISNTAKEIAGNNKNLLGYDVPAEQIEIALRIYLAAALIERQARLFHKQLKTTDNPPSVETISDATRLIQSINPGNEIDPSTIFCAMFTPIELEDMPTWIEEQKQVSLTRLKPNTSWLPFSSNTATKDKESINKLAEARMAVIEEIQRRTMLKQPLLSPPPPTEDLDEKPAAAPQIGPNPFELNSNDPTHQWIQEEVEKGIRRIPSGTPIDTIVSTYQNAIDAWAQDLAQLIVKADSRLAGPALIGQVKAALRLHLANGLIERQARLFKEQLTTNNPPSVETITDATNLIKGINPQNPIPVSTIFRTMFKDPQEIKTMLSSTQGKIQKEGTNNKIAVLTMAQSWMEFTQTPASPAAVSTTLPVAPVSPQQPSSEALGKRPANGGQAAPVLTPAETKLEELCAATNIRSPLYQFHHWELSVKIAQYEGQIAAIAAQCSVDEDTVRARLTTRLLEEHCASVLVKLEYDLHGKFPKSLKKEEEMLEAFARTDFDASYRRVIESKIGKLIAKRADSIQNQSGNGKLEATIRLYTKAARLDTSSTFSEVFTLKLREALTERLVNQQKELFSDRLKSESKSLPTLDEISKAAKSIQKFSQGENPFSKILPNLFDQGIAHARDNVGKELAKAQKPPSTSAQKTTREAIEARARGKLELINKVEKKLAKLEQAASSSSPLGVKFDLGETAPESKAITIEVDCIMPTGHSCSYTLGMQVEGRDKIQILEKVPGQSTKWKLERKRDVWRAGEEITFRFVFLNEQTLKPEKFEHGDKHTLNRRKSQEKFKFGHFSRTPQKSSTSASSESTSTSSEGSSSS